MNKQYHKIDDLALLITTLADTLIGYPVKKLASGWEEAVARLESPDGLELGLATSEDLLVGNTDVELAICALKDLHNGYPERELAERWRDSAGRLIAYLRLAGCEDEGAWDEIATPEDTPSVGM